MSYRDMMGGAKWVYERFLKQYKIEKSAERKKTPPVSNQIGGKRKVVKGRLGNAQFQVNPTTISYGGGMNWTEVPSAGMSVPLMQLGCGMSNTFSFELYINEWMFDYKVNAQEFVNEIFRCRGSQRPVKFIIGKMVKDVIVNSCEITAQSFNPDMTFREVTMSITLTTVYL